MLTWKALDSIRRSEYFWSRRENGEWSCGNSESYYLKSSDPMQASYDTGNNKVITASAPDGSIRYFTIFKPSQFSDNIPGVWVIKDRILVTNLSFGARIGGKEFRLPEIDAVRTDLLECAVPETTYTMDGLEFRVMAFAPISADGKARPRGAFYTLRVQNTGSEAVKATLLNPKLPHFSQVMNAESHGFGDIHLVDFVNADDGSRAAETDVALQPGESYALPLWICAYGETMDCLQGRSMLYWLEQTLEYYRALFGELVLEDQPFLCEFLKRTLCQCQQCIGMDGAGKIAGSSWGTNPTTYHIWMKDMYYSMLPLAQTDPELFRMGMEWFAEYGVRPRGVQFEGGVSHSLSNSLSSVMMAGQYYYATGDAAYFRENPALVDRLIAILDEMLASRGDWELWLYPSMWISDGLCMGDFHTGSNICAWVALKSMADIIEAARCDCEKASTYRRVAEKIRETILDICVTDGPYGKQFLEGVGMGSEEIQQKMKADSLEEFLAKNSGFGVQFYEFYNRKDDGPYLVHDGEETDTTLISYYGMMPYDEPVFKNYTRFAMTEENRFYCSVSKGIIWEDCSDSTFPGYVTSLANTVDSASFENAFGVIRNLTDLDGSIWWWPYEHAAKDHSVIKRVPGKCGWASGALLALFRNDILGVRYTAPEKLLSLKPLNAIGKIDWKGLPCGSAKFDLSCDGAKLTVRNTNSFAVKLRIEMFGSNLTVNGKCADACKGVYLDRPTVIFETELLPGEKMGFIAE